MPDIDVETLARRLHKLLITRPMQDFYSVQVDRIDPVSRTYEFVSYDELDTNRRLVLITMAEELLDEKGSR